jgi:iron complex outermembrane receptor protein
MASRHIRNLLAATALVAASLATMPACAGGSAQQHYELAPQALDQALRAVGRMSGREIMVAADDVRGKQAPALRGDYTADDAIGALLAGSGLTARFEAETVYVAAASQEGSATVPSATGRRSADSLTPDSATIVVTGSRLRGVPLSSPTIQITQSAMLKAGKTSLGDVVRSIPQNFGGGQNPGIGFNAPVASGEDIGSASTINLRGIGQDATLTLLNGHRLAYGGYKQNIDVSSIPIAAVDRIEIVTDGASAIYGSDAVAGVANIILKRDYDGLLAQARGGAATDGGDKQQQYSLTGGRSWASGGFIAAYDFERDTAIEARQRGYAAGPSAGLTLYPFFKRHDLLVSGHQLLANDLELAVDAVYNHRADRRHYDVPVAPDLYSYTVRAKSHSFAVAPSLDLGVGDSWHVVAAATAGEDRTYYGTDETAFGATAKTLRGCYCNKGWSAELGGSGTLLSLPSGEVKVATGAGYRSNNFRAFRTVGPYQQVEGTQNSHYGYAEINLPLAAPAQGRSLLYRLNLNGAVRYEDYAGVGRLATPKLGLVYAPIAAVDLKASWGRSFKAPTLFQRFNAQTANLLTARQRGGTGYPATATVIERNGGNPDLEPERARSWTFGVAAHPPTVPGLQIEANLFDIRYRGRVVAPISIGGQSLSNPAYAEAVTLNPSDAQKAAIADPGGFTNNFSGRPYDPATVIALIDNRNRNVAGQTIRGVDLSGSYRFAVADTGELTISGSTSYIESRQRLSALAPTIDLAGTIFNPPHWRGRGGIVWDRQRVSLSLYGNYIGPVTDARTVAPVHVRAMTTADATLVYAIGPDAGPLSRVDITVTVQNMFNARPGLIATTDVYDPNYDSTNYSPIGRFVSLAVSKAW